MKIASPVADRRAVVVNDFELSTVTDGEVAEIKEHIYRDKIVVLKNQQLDVAQFVALGKLFGTPEPYYEPIYHHPEDPLVFVSSNVPHDGKQLGVPKTGAFWHADYQFMPRPFAFTIFYPQKLPTTGRGTYFIDMAQAYNGLSSQLQERISGTHAHHSVRRYVKIRPSDVYRPLGHVIEDVEKKTPPQAFPTVFTHPVTGEQILYASEAFTYRMSDADGNDLGDELLTAVMEESGQLDPTFENPNIFTLTYEPGDIVLWDNRTLIHRALHNPSNQATESFRVTVHDDHPLYEQAQ